MSARPISQVAKKVFNTPCNNTVAFAERFRASQFVKNYRLGEHIVVKNVATSESAGVVSKGIKGNPRALPVFAGQHFGMKRDLPVPGDGHRIIHVEEFDRPLRYTPFTDVSQDAGTRVVAMHLRRALQDRRPVQGRFLSHAGNGDYIIGVAGLLATLPRQSLDVSRQEANAMVNERRTAHFYVTGFTKQSPVSGLPGPILSMSPPAEGTKNESATSNPSSPTTSK